MDGWSCPVSHPRPSSSISVPGSASPWFCPSVCPSSLVHFSPSPRSLPSFCLSLSLSLSWLLSVFLSPSTALSVSPHLLSLPVSSLSIFVSPPPLSLSFSAGRVGSGGSGTARPGARRPGEQCPIHAALRCHGNALAPPSPPLQRVPRGCHGYVRRVPAPRVASPRALGRARPAGGARLQPLP